jgi:hypothetical protein
VWAVASEHEEAAAVDVANPMIVGDVVGRSDGRSDGGVCAWHGKGPVVTECDRGLGRGSSMSSGRASRRPRTSNRTRLEQILVNKF